MSAPYQAVDPGDELRDLVLAELDPLFDGIPSQTYVQHISQNWANEPFVRAAYLADYADSDISQDLGKHRPTGLHGGLQLHAQYDWSSVHTAVRSACDVSTRCTASAAPAAVKNRTAGRPASPDTQIVHRGDHDPVDIDLVRPVGEVDSKFCPPPFPLPPHDEMVRRRIADRKGTVEQR